MPPNRKETRNWKHYCFVDDKASNLAYASGKEWPLRFGTIVHHVEFQRYRPDGRRPEGIRAYDRGNRMAVADPCTGLSGCCETAGRKPDCHSHGTVFPGCLHPRAALRAFFQGRTISIGIASFPEHGSNGDLIFEKADKALYRAKREGRNQIAIYELEKDAR